MVERARLFWVSLVALALVVLEGILLWGAVSLARAGAIVPDALWVLAAGVLGAIAFVASGLRSPR